MQFVMANAAAFMGQDGISYGSSLLAEVARIRADAERLQHEHENRRDLWGALRAIETRLSVIELEARFTGQIEVKQKNELHLHFTRRQGAGSRANVCRTAWSREANSVVAVSSGDRVGGG